MSFLRDPNRLIATLIAGVVGLIVLADFASIAPLINQMSFLLVNWAAVLTALALLVGLLSVAGSHVGRVIKRESDWGYSMVLLIAMLTVIGVGVAGPPGINLIEAPIRIFFRAVYEPLASSLLALLAFFSLSAMLRALRSRQVEALVVVGVALVILILQLPPVLGLPFVVDSLQWFNEYVALAGARGLLLGVAIGTLVAGVRVLLGFDQPYLDR